MHLGQGQVVHLCLLPQGQCDRTLPDLVTRAEYRLREDDGGMMQHQQLVKQAAREQTCSVTSLCPKHSA